MLSTGALLQVTSTLASDAKLTTNGLFQVLGKLPFALFNLKSFNLGLPRRDAD